MQPCWGKGGSGTVTSAGWQVTLIAFRGLRNSLGCFSHVKNIDLHCITLHPMWHVSSSSGVAAL